LEISFDKPGTYKGNSVVLTAKNDCGNTSYIPTEALTVLDSYGKPGPDMPCGDSIYATWELIPGLYLMRDFSKEGNPDFTAAPMDPDNRQYGFYYYENRLTACPSPWTLNPDVIYSTVSICNGGSKDLFNVLYDNTPTGYYDISGLPSSSTEGGGPLWSGFQMNDTRPNGSYSALVYKNKESLGGSFNVPENRACVVKCTLNTR
jgi:hypothetical protein